MVRISVEDDGDLEEVVVSSEPPKHRPEDYQACVLIEVGDEPGDYKIADEPGSYALLLIGPNGEEYYDIHIIENLGDNPEETLRKRIKEQYPKVKKMVSSGRVYHGKPVTNHVVPEEKTLDEVIDDHKGTPDDMDEKLRKEALEEGYRDGSEIDVYVRHRKQEIRQGSLTIIIEPDLHEKIISDNGAIKKEVRKDIYKFIVKYELEAKRKGLTGEKAKEYVSEQVNDALEDKYLDG